MKPKVITRPASSATRRISQTATARETLAGFGKGIELDCLTMGQFSLIDAIDAVLEITGPAEVDVSTWTAAGYDLSELERQLKASQITALRFIADRSILSRHPHLAANIEQFFGKGCVRTTRTHAKFVLIRNDDWRVVVRTSMNMNHNPRIEYIQVCDDEGLHDFYQSIVSEIFREEPEGINGKASTPGLAGLETFQRQQSITFDNRPTVGKI